MPMTTPVQIYWCRFNREGASLFQDFPAYSAFTNEYFVDFFGKTWIPSHPDAFSLDSVLQSFSDDSIKPGSNTFFEVFAISDGSTVESTPENKPWLKQTIRSIALIAGNDIQQQAQPFDSNSWTLCVVASSKPKDTERFLQVVSWDGNRFRYYGREHVGGDESQPNAWIYQGDSFDAFGDQAYLGLFHGHMNASVVMKELHQTWIRRLAPRTGFANNAASDVLAQYDEFPYLSDGTSHDLSKVQGANTLEAFIRSGLNKWTHSRCQADFVDAQGHPLVQVKSVKRLVAHLLLITTVDVISAIPDASPGHENAVLFPMSHFYNADAFENSAAKPIQPSSTQTPLEFGLDMYQAAVDAMKLAVVQIYPDSNQPQPEIKQHPSAGMVDISGEVAEIFVVEYGEG